MSDWEKSFVGYAGTEGPRTLSIRVDGADQAGEARRYALRLAGGLGFDETAKSRAGLVVTECANNLWKHAGGGEILLGAAVDGESLEILSLDKGPGMHDPERCFQDGYSTAGSAGTGLGAVRRLASEYSLFTVPGKGTALLARVSRQGRPVAPGLPACLEVGGISVPKSGENVCGDGYAIHHDNGFSTVMVVDGLGHGEFAHDCALIAEEAFRENVGMEPLEMLRTMDGALRSTRGAALAVARLDYRNREIRYAGIGNIAGVICPEGHSRQMLSYPGIVGHDSRNVKQLTYEWGKNVLVLLYSDGITSHWNLDLYAGLRFHDPSLIAGVLYRDWTRGRDDSTIVVLREKAVL